MRGRDTLSESVMVVQADKHLHYINIIKYTRIRGAGRGTIHQHAYFALNANGIMYRRGWVQYYTVLRYNPPYTGRKECRGALFLASDTRERRD